MRTSGADLKKLSLPQFFVVVTHFSFTCPYTYVASLVGMRRRDCVTYYTYAIKCYPVLYVIMKYAYMYLFMVTKLLHLTKFDHVKGHIVELSFAV